jgi:hypothetical protein
MSRCSSLVGVCVCAKAAPMAAASAAPAAKASFFIVNLLSVESRQRREQPELSRNSRPAGSTKCFQL